jgi:hypothetical protein
MASFQFSKGRRVLHAMFAERLLARSGRPHSVPPLLTDIVPRDSLLPDSTFGSDFHASQSGLEIYEDDSGFEVTQPGEMCTLSFGHRG